MLQTGVVGKLKTHSLCSLTFSPNRVHKLEKCCKAGRATVDTKIHRMPFWMLDNYGYKHTLRIYNTYCFSTATMITRARLNFTLYIYCLFFLVKNSLLLFIVYVQLKNTCFDLFLLQRNARLPLSLFFLLPLNFHARSINLPCMVFCSN
jgi:hypothetical protein